MYEAEEDKTAHPVEYYERFPAPQHALLPYLDSNFHVCITQEKKGWVSLDHTQI